MKEGQNENVIVNKNKVENKKWELSPEDSNFFDRKIKALAYFYGELNKKGEESAQFSSDKISGLEKSVNNLNLDNSSPEEVNLIKNRLNALESQKQQVIQEGKRKIEGTDIKTTDVGYTPFEEVKEIENVEKIDDSKISQRPDITNNIKPVENSVSPEEAEEKPLEQGDEVYRNGVFYKIHDFLPENEPDFYSTNHMGNSMDKPGSFRHFDKKTQSYVVTEEKRIGPHENALNERDSKPHRYFRAVITEGGFGGGKGGYEHFTEDQVTRVTPELKAKILKMKRESGRGDSFATGE